MGSGEKVTVREMKIVCVSQSVRNSMIQRKFGRSREYVRVSGMHRLDYRGKERERGSGSDSETVTDDNKMMTKLKVKMTA